MFLLIEHTSLVKKKKEKKTSLIEKFYSKH